MKINKITNRNRIKFSWMFCVCLALATFSCQDKDDNSGFIVPEPVLTFEGEIVNLPKEAVKQEVVIYSNLPWRVKTEANWIDMIVSNGQGDGTFILQASKNTEIGIREATVRAWIVEGKEKSIKIVQQGMGIALKSRLMNISGNKDNLKVPFSTIVPYTCETSDTWLQVTDKPTFVVGTVNNLELTLSVDAYTGEGEREGFMYLKGENLTVDTLKVVQSKAEVELTDRDALKAFFEKANGSKWVKKWNLDAPLETNEENWIGITFTNERVTKIKFGMDNGIKGDISSLCNLTEMQVIDLRRQHLTAIPQEIGQLTKLTQLIVAECAVSGIIPESIGKCKLLQVFNISNHPTNTPDGYNNTLSGGLDALLEVPGIVTIKAYCNNLSGNLPMIPLKDNKPTTWLSLKEFMIYSNAFTGIIPFGYGAVIGKNGTAGLFWVNDNQLSGKIPDDIKALPNYNKDKANRILKGNSLIE